MSLIGSLNIGVTATTAGLSKGLKSASSQVSTFASTGGSALGTIAKVAATAFAGFSAVEGIRTAVSAASDLNEVTTKTDAVLGPAAGAVKAYADEVADKFGLVKSETLDAASGFGALGKGLGGLQGQDLSDFAIQFTQLTGDLSSFANMSFQEAGAALRTQLGGEQSDALKRLGVVTTETTLKQYAYQQGIAKTGAALTEQQKLQARAGLIMRSLADAQGDLAKTADGVANRTRAIGGRLQNFAAEVGMAIQPITNVFLDLAGTTLEKVAPAMIAGAKWISGAFIDLTNTILPGVQSIGTMLWNIPAAAEGAFGAGTMGLLGEFAAALKGDVLNALDLLGLAWRNLPDFVAIAGIKVSEVLTNMGAYIAVIPTNLGLIGDYIANNWRTLVIDGVNAVAMAFSNLGKNFYDLGAAIVAFIQDPTQGFQFNFTPILQGFTALTSELPTLVGPELVSFQDQIDEKVAAIGDREAARAQDMAASAGEQVAPTAAPATPAADAAAMAALPAAGKEPKKMNVGALELGSAEARSAILAAQTGGAGGDSMSRLAKTNTDQLGELKGLRSDLKRAGRTGETPKVLSLT